MSLWGVFTDTVWKSLGKEMAWNSLLTREIWLMSSSSHSSMISMTMSFEMLLIVVFWPGMNSGHQVGCGSPSSDSDSSSHH